MTPEDFDVWPFLTAAEWRGLKAALRAWELGVADRASAEAAIEAAAALSLERVPYAKAAA